MVVGTDGELGERTMEPKTAEPKRPKIKIPADAVRTPEQILAGATVRNGHVWIECHHCGGSGNYPSSCIPVGRCYLYCWQGRTPETYR